MEKAKGRRKNGIVAKVALFLLATLLLGALMPLAFASEGRFSGTNFLGDLLIVVSFALADSINPCIMSILVLLLAQLATIKATKRAKKIGFTYVIAVFFSYLFLGILMAAGFSIANALFFWVMPYVKTVLVFGILVAGAVNIKDFFAYGSGISFSIPKKYKNMVEGFAVKGTVIATIALAAIVTLIEFPCTGAMYAGLIYRMVALEMNYALILTYLIIYNIIFVLPLGFILVAYTKGFSTEKLDKFRLKYRRIFRLLMGIALIILAYIVWVV